MDNVMGQINYLAVLAAAASAFLLGGLWYGPMFQNVWMDASGVTPETRQPRHGPTVFVIAFAWALLGALFFAMFLGPAPALGFATAVGFGTGSSGSPAHSRSITSSKESR